MAEVAQRRECDGRRIAVDRLHMTLAFHGLLARHEIAGLCRKAAAIRVAPFKLRLDRLGYFQRPRIAWLGTTEPPPELLELVAGLSGTRNAGRNFQPHVSLARGASRPAPPEQVEPIVWQVRNFCLLESGRDGIPGMYTCIQQWRLG